jgi:hypothetical protein|nr:MAG TPA: holin [Caudoviricetes sp.]
MFKNSVLKPDVDTVEWCKKAGIRAVKTMAQSAIGAIGAAATMGAVDWRIVGSTAALAGVLSILTSVAGIPEVEGTVSE